MELLKKLKTAQIPKDDIPEQEINFLDDSNLTKIVNKGLAELYRLKPENPITFLANFLLNEDHAKVLLNRISQSKELKKETEEKMQKEEEYITQLTEESNKREEEKNEIKQKLRDTIINCEDFEDGLNDICEQLKNIIGATGVYISIYDLKRKGVNSLDEDENAHIDPENINVLRYIHWNNDHDFLHGKILEPKQGVTYSLFMDVSGDEEGEEGGEEPAPEKNEGEEGEEGEVDDKKEDVIKSIEIQDVVMDNKIKFFREPRLGSYLAYNISYQSSLSYKSLLSAINNLNDYNTKNEEYEKLKAEKEEQEKLNKENKEGNEEEEEEEEKKENEGEEGEEEEGEKLIKPQLEDFEKEGKTLILSMDTLGQDRTFSESEKEFANEIAKLIRDSIQLREKTLLEKDRDLRNDYMKIEKPLVEDWTPEKIEAEADNGMKDYLASEEFTNKNIVDDGQRKVEEDYGRANWNIQTLVSTDFLQCLEMFAQFEFVEYEKVFQNILYFAHVEPKEINEPETNKLCWKLARKH